MSDENAPERSGIQAEPAHASPLTKDASLRYFPVSLIKFVVMNCCTLGAYQYYWIYKNWQCIQERECLGIQPFWRAFFGVIYCFPLLKKIEESGESLHLRQSIPSTVLAGGWVLVSLLFWLPDPYWLVTFLSVVFLVPAQHQINRINEQSAPGHDPNTRFTAWNIVAVVAGGAVFVLSIIVAFIVKR